MRDDDSSLPSFLPSFLPSCLSLVYGGRLILRSRSLARSPPRSSLLGGSVCNVLACVRASLPPSTHPSQSVTPSRRGRTPAAATTLRRARPSARSLCCRGRRTRRRPRDDATAWMWNDVASTEQTGLRAESARCSTDSRERSLRHRLQAWRRRLRLRRGEERTRDDVSAASRGDESPTRLSLDAEVETSVGRLAGCIAH